MISMQLLDNCLLQAGIFMDQNRFLERINSIMSKALQNTPSNNSGDAGVTIEENVNSNG
jgi:hypothetical protein